VEDCDLRKKLAYEESIRSLEQQSASLDDLRSRTGILLAALALSASFLGARALDISGFSAWSWVAIGCFAGAGFFSLAVLWPSGDWHFTSKAGTILEDLEADDSITLDEMHGTYAKSNQEDRDANDRKLGRLFWFFRVAVVALILQVGFWLIALGNPHASTEKTQETTAKTAKPAPQTRAQGKLAGSATPQARRNAESP
jgi:hypothetical protein